MKGDFSWGTAFKIARRESRASSAKFLFVVLAVAIGVGALTGVRGFSRAFGTMLLREARTLLAADLSVRVFSLPSPQQQAVMDGLAQRGVRHTWITETISMAARPGTDLPVLVSAKAVDPAVYPFYGKVKLNPPGILPQVLDSQSVAVGEDLLIRLNARLGDSIRIGGADFRIAAIVVSEPDRMAGSLNVGPRLMMSRAGLERTGLIVPGSRAAERFLFQLPPGAQNIEQVRKELKGAFPDALIADFRETHPLIKHGLDDATTFLSLVSLIALIVGALGVATAIHSHLQQKQDTIAIMKCLGARSGQIIRIYLIQTLMLGLAGGLVGVLVGSGVKRMFPLLIERYFSMKPDLGWDLVPALQGMAVGILTALLFTVPPLLSIRGVRPNLIFRREMEEVRKSWRLRWKESKAAALSGAAIVAGIGLIAAWLSESAKLGGFFVLGLVVSLLALSGIAWLLLRVLKLFVRRTARKLPVSVRHGIANLYRPGNHAQATLVALGIGVMFTLTVYLVQRSLLVQLMASAPPGMPNVFLINVTDREHAGLLGLLKQQKGIQGDVELVPAIAVRLVSVDGSPVTKLSLQGWRRHYQREMTVTWRAEKPAQSKILNGAWWSSGSQPEPLVAVAEEAANLLKAKPGSHLEWAAMGRTFPVRVAAIYRNESIRAGSNIEFIFNPGSLDGLPVLYYAGLRMRPDSVGAMQRAAYRLFPTVTVINVADVIQIVQGVVDQVSLVIRFISAFAILGGVIILASSVAGTRFRRIREVAILKTLGSTRNRLAAIFSVEFLILGAVAGTMGSLLATGFAALLLKRMFQSADFRFDPLPNLLCIVATALLATAAGWAASFRILGQKPLEVLRDE